MIRNNVLQYIIFLFFLTLTLSYAVFSEEMKTYLGQRKDATFQLHILKGDSFKILGNATYEQAIQILKKINILTESDFLITEHDINKYNWLEQSMTLTLDKSMEILKKYISKDISREDFLTRKYSWSDIEYALHTSIFLIMLEDEKLYGGIFTQNATAMGVSYPVIYIQPGTEVSLEPFKLQIKIIIRPLSSFFSYNSYKSMKPYIKQRIEIPEIYDFFSKIGKLIVK